MAIRDRMRASAAQFVDPGETIQEVFGALNVRPLIYGLARSFGLIGALIWGRNVQFRIVAVTDQRILVLNAGSRNMKDALWVVDVLPRTTTLGPPKGITHYAIGTPSGKIWVHRSFFKDIKAADTQVTPAVSH
jgi:hypothetical protein